MKYGRSFSLQDIWTTSRAPLGPTMIPQLLFLFSMTILEYKNLKSHIVNNLESQTD